MSLDEQGTTRDDWASGGWKRWVAWHIPTVALVAAFFFDAPTRALVWPVALSWMGIACLLNARRCGRRHCFLTGPFFLVMGVASLLHGSGIVSLGNHGWSWLGAILLALGYGLLWKLPEYLWGTYVRQKQGTLIPPA